MPKSSMTFWRSCAQAASHKNSPNCSTREAREARLLLRQREYVQRVAVGRVMDFRRDRGRHLTRAAAAQAGGDCNILPSAHAERNRISLHGGSQTRFP